MSSWRLATLSASIVASFAADVDGDPTSEAPLPLMAGTVDSRALRAHEIRVSLAQQSAANAVSKAALRDLGPQRSGYQSEVPPACCGTLPPGPPPPPSAQCNFSPLWRFEMPPFLLPDGAHLRP
eukprot:COSAG02_NODE_491_length_21224_cov_5.973680_9_plen_124_part_00